MLFNNSRILSDSTLSKGEKLDRLLTVIPCAIRLKKKI